MNPAIAPLALAATLALVGCQSGPLDWNEGPMLTLAVPAPEKAPTAPVKPPAEPAPEYAPSCRDKAPTGKTWGHECSTDGGLRSAELVCCEMRRPLKPDAKGHYGYATDADPTYPGVTRGTPRPSAPPPAVEGDDEAPKARKAKVCGPRSRTPGKAPRTMRCDGSGELANPSCTPCKGSKSGGKGKGAK